MFVVLPLNRPANERTRLLLPEDEVVELLLQNLVRVVDQELLEVVVREDLKPCSMKTATRQNANRASWPGLNTL